LAFHEYTERKAKREASNLQQNIENWRTAQKIQQGYAAKREQEEARRARNRKEWEEKEKFFEELRRQKNSEASGSGSRSQ